jgi:DNA repair exonuclease SbcCD nuclease subunit
MTRILLIGDIHIGRRPSRLPEDLEDHRVSVSELTPAAAWHRAVRYACDQGLDAVVLAGDVVEYDNYMFEAFGHVERGVKQLVEAGIPVYAVAGNHDVEALPRLADLIPEFRLVGRGGRWECVTVARDGVTLFHLLGWSYPERRVTRNPLEGAALPALPDDHHPLFGILHGDLDAGGGPYAPVRRRDLDHPRVDGWFLGHIHKPSDLTGKPPLGYLGSLVGLDPNETGPRGAWLLNIAQTGDLELRHVPLAPMRWEKVALPVDGLESLDDVPSLVKGNLETLNRDIEDSLGETKVVGCRLAFTGRTRLHRELRRALEDDDIRNLRLTRNDVLYFIDKVEDDSAPEIDLAAVARGTDPPAILAKMISSLEAAEGAGPELARQALSRLNRAVGGLPWFQQEGWELRDLLMRAGRIALEELLGQDSGPTSEGDER